jgi:hypothetical protein
VTPNNLTPKNKRKPSVRPLSEITLPSDMESYRTSKSYRASKSVVAELEERRAQRAALQAAIEDVPLWLVRAMRCAADVWEAEMLAGTINRLDLRALRELHLIIGHMPSGSPFIVSDCPVCEAGQ